MECPECGGIMFRVAGKLICERCGYKEDAK